MINLLLSFDGRISRTQFWIGIGFILAAELVLTLALGIPIFPEEMKAFSIRLIDFAIELVTLYPMAAITVKRLHDRNQPGIYAVWLIGPMTIATFTNLFGLTGDPKNLTWLDWVLALCMIVVVLASVFELGFRPGTPGENRYGPNPLGKPVN